MSSEQIIRKVALRGAGAILGTLFVIVGGIALFFFDEVAPAKRVIGGISIVFLGIYFINYAVTGRSYLRGRPPI